jgi:glycosyltransferase involved in cell wall biosynthesis
MTLSESPLVSILMTAYNREKYIGAAIESVLASTYTQFELIVVDDRSKDRTVEIARGYEAKDSRLRVYINETNLGDYPNRNQAASYAKGVYLKYVDADDYIYPWGLGLLVRMMEQFPDCGWGLCSLPQNIKEPFPIRLTPAEAYQYHYLGPGLFHKAPLSSIIRTAVFNEVKGFSLQRMVGDMEMWHKLALNYNVLLMPEGIVWYREHDAQEMNSYFRFMKDYENVSIRYLTSKACPMPQEAVSRIFRAKKRSLLRQAIKSAVLLKGKQFRSNWKCLKAYYAG